VLPRLAFFAVLAVLLAGCGGKVVAPVAQTVVGTLPTTAPEPPVPAQYKNGDPAAGKQVFTSKGCTACHTLKDAGATGTVGPNLDVSKPTLSRAVDRLLNGGNAGGAAMPPFKGALTTKQIADVAAYVVKASRQG
jgi:mono/diheme cytochrome c family protein